MSHAQARINRETKQKNRDQARLPVVAVELFPGRCWSGKHVCVLFFPLTPAPARQKKKSENRFSASIGLAVNGAPIITNPLRECASMEGAHQTIDAAS